MGFQEQNFNEPEGIEIVQVSKITNAARSNFCNVNQSYSESNTLGCFSEGTDASLKTPHIFVSVGTSNRAVNSLSYNITSPVEEKNSTSFSTSFALNESMVDSHQEQNFFDNFASLEKNTIPSINVSAYDTALEVQSSSANASSIYLTPVSYDNNPLTCNWSQTNESNFGGTTAAEQASKKNIKEIWLIAEHAKKLLEKQENAQRAAFTLGLIPFDAKRIPNAPKGLKEILLLLIVQLMLLRAQQITSNRCTESFHQHLAQWMKKTILRMISLFDLANTAFQSALDKIDLWKENQGDLCSDCNPQPLKAVVLAQCEEIYGNQFNILFEKKRLELLSQREKTNLEHSHSASQSPKHTTSDTHSLKLPGSFQFLTPEKHTKNLLNTPKVDLFDSLEALERPSTVAIFLRDMLFICVQESIYDARFQSILDILSEALDVTSTEIRLAVEDMLLCDLAGSMKHKHKESVHARNLRRLKVAGVAVGLGAVTALTAGIAAPAMAAGIGALGITGTSGAVTFLSTLGGSATLASIFGAGSAGISGWKYSRRIGKIRIFKFERLEEICKEQLAQEENTTSSAFVSLSSSSSSSFSSILDSKQPKSKQDTERKSDFANKYKHTDSDDESNHSLIRQENSNVIDFPELSDLAQKQQHRYFSLTHPSTIQKQSLLSLSVAICISGWLKDISDVWLPWKSLVNSPNDVYTLRWDPNILLTLGNLVVNMLSQRFAVSAAQLWLQTTVAGALSTALMWPVAIIQYAATLDNAWMACKERAIQAGKILASALSDKCSTGIRPITLIGYSMGASVIFHCMLELKRRNEYHLLENVIMMGTPETADKSTWSQAREVVSNRLVNIYCSSDWLLGFLYRYMEWRVSVAGLSPVKFPGIENYDVSELIRNHYQYSENIINLLAYIDYFAIPSQTIRLH